MTTTALTIAGGVNSLTGGAITNALGFGPDSPGGGGGGVNSAYDPYGPYRADAAKRLNDLMIDPSMALGDPGYASQLQQGMNTVNRGMAKTGQLQSGAEQVALQDLGQNTFGSYFNSKLANLMQLSGASQNPAAAGQAQNQANLYAAQIANANANMFTSGIGSIAGGIKSIYNTPTSNYDAGNYNYGSYGSFGTGGVARDALGVPLVEDI